MRVHYIILLKIFLTISTLQSFFFFFFLRCWDKVGHGDKSKEGLGHMLGA